MPGEAPDGPRPVAGADPPGRATGRLEAVDVARCVALIGMMAVHVLPAEPGAAGAVHSLAGGRSAALFAVLAGVGLALGSDGAHRDPARRPQARRAIAIRSVAVAAIGLTLGLLVTPVAIILVHYAVLFLVAIPLLGWPPARLAAAAAAWALLSPVVSQLIRLAGHLDGPGPNPSWLDLADLPRLASHLLLTGYYPVLTWVTYLLAGLAAGRLTLSSARTGRWLVGVGAGLAMAGWAAAAIGVRLAGGTAVLAAALPPGAPTAGRGDGLLDDTFYGTTPTTSWWFLTVMAPHSGAGPDLVHTTGTALLVLGLSVLVVPRAAGRLRVLAAAGSMTLTLYCVHAIVLGTVLAVDPDRTVPVWPLLIANVVPALVFATWWGSPGRRGPAEEMVATAVEAGAGGR